MAKPTKRQRAIIALLNVVEGEGLHYGLCNYGVTDEVAIIKDDELTDLVKTMQEVTEKLEAKLEELGEEVVPFMADDSDF